MEAGQSQKTAALTDKNQREHCGPSIHGKQLVQPDERLWRPPGLIPSPDAPAHLIRVLFDFPADDPAEFGVVFPQNILTRFDSTQCVVPQLSLARR